MKALSASMTFPGSLNTNSFLVFIEQILLRMLWVGAIVVMDNLPVHYATIATNLIESVGAKVKFLALHLGKMIRVFLDSKKPQVTVFFLIRKNTAT